MKLIRKLSNAFNAGVQLIYCFSFRKIQRYEARHRLIGTLAARNGLRVYNKNLAWHKDEEFLKIWNNFPGSPSSQIIHERRFILYSLAKSIKHIPGDIAECGVFKGGAAYLMMEAQEYNDKSYYGFDSFNGLSEPDARDEVSSDCTFIWKKNDMNVGEDAARTNLSAFGKKINLYKGWIPTRFAEVENQQFSLVHIDVDLFEPTYESIKFFFPRLSSGGLVVCDDYGFESCPGAKLAMDKFSSELGLSVIHLTTGQGVLIKG